MPLGRLRLPSRPDACLRQRIPAMRYRLPAGVWLAVGPELCLPIAELRTGRMAGEGMTISQSMAHPLIADLRILRILTLCKGALPCAHAVKGVGDCWGLCRGVCGR